MKFKEYGLGLMNFWIAVGSKICSNGVPQTPERFEEYTLRKGFEYTKSVYQNANLTEEKMQGFKLFCEAGEKFLNSIGTLADKSILRSNDTSTLYPPDNALMAVEFQFSYQQIYTQKIENSLKKEENEILLELFKNQA